MNTLSKGLRKENVVTEKRQDSYGYGLQVFAGIALVGVYYIVRRWAPNNIAWTVVLTIAMLLAVVSLFRKQWSQTRFWFLTFVLFGIHTWAWISYVPLNANVNLLNVLLIIVPEGIAMLFIIGKVMGDKSLEDD